LDGHLQDLTPATPPYWRLSAFYLFYFASLGALIPYWSLYLQFLGFSVVEIGELVAILVATKIIAPNLWGWVADHTGRRMSIIRWAALCAVVAFAGVFIAKSYWWLAFVIALFSFFWNAALPQFEAITLNHLGSDAHRYTVIRLWGSVGFIVAVASLGPVLGVYGPGVLPGILIVLFTGIWLMSLLAPDRSTDPASHHDEPLFKVLRRPEVRSLLLVCFLIQASHGPYYTFFTIYLEGFGYSRTTVGQLWALGVFAEIGVFLVMHRWLPRFGARSLLLVALFLTTLRWVLIGQFPQQLPVLLVAQCLHAASFGIYHAVAIHLIHRLFTGPHQGRGQALYSSLSFGAGGALGSFASGYLWDAIGPSRVYLVAAVVSALAWWVAYRGVNERV